MTSSRRRLQPPQGGTPPPQQASFVGRPIFLGPLAERICHRYRDQFRDEEERYGDAGIAWCVHDLQWILAWAADGELHENLEWLARVLAAREFPLERLARALELAAETLEEALDGPSEAASALASEARALAGRLGLA
ncbi:MAG: hypothetical protein M3310_07625 [Actinomycetota bacterium]|nr:hypothetical protein [Actinomycetota bacterium]